jgi:RNA recognition motif-containing protein
MGTRLFVAGLAWRTTEEGLARHLSSVGEVTSARIVTDRETRRSKGYAFVDMATPEQAVRAIKELDDVALDDRRLTIQEARSRDADQGPRSTFRGSPPQSMVHSPDRRHW